jgi:hypothetical protein
VRRCPIDKKCRRQAVNENLVFHALLPIESQKLNSKDRGGTVRPKLASLFRPRDQSRPIVLDLHISNCIRGVMGEESCRQIT